MLPYLSMQVVLATVLESWVGVDRGEETIALSVWVNWSASFSVWSSSARQSKRFGDVKSEFITSSTTLSRSEWSYSDDVVSLIISGGFCVGEGEEFDPDGLSWSARKVSLLLGCFCFWRVMLGLGRCSGGEIIAA